MHEWTHEFIANAQQELVGMVKDWQYDYGADNRACSAMLLWMVQKLNPAVRIDLGMLQDLDPVPAEDRSALGQRKGFDEQRWQREKGSVLSLRTPSSMEWSVSMTPSGKCCWPGLHLETPNAF